jgi:acetyltransferase EpsM
MKSFVIVGTGGMGRELLGWIAGCNEAMRERFRVAAFISEAGDAGKEIHGVPVLHPDDWTGDVPRFVIAFADPTKKKRLALELEARGWQPEIFVHDSAVVGLAATIGAGTVICPFSRISTDCTIGRHVLVNGASGIGHDAVVGSYSSLLGSVNVNGSAKVGEGAMLGAGSMIYPGKRVGDWAVVGLSSVVLRNVPAKATVFGSPAQRIDVARPSSS